MENTNWDSAQDAAPQNDWQDAETNASVSDAARDNDPISEVNRYSIAEDDEHIHAMSGIDAPDPDDEDEDEDDDNDNDDDNDEDDEKGDWGHVDPAEGNSPFPDSNEPGFPGSAV
ncbi:MAG: hypothetical protein ABIQ27_07160 [Flavobacterium sp.]|uniref:hypothetical protein n=1 Tax=Flavobacterium sp. TaxID=239 RepID=UPI003266F746